MARDAAGYAQVESDRLTLEPAGTDVAGLLRSAVQQALALGGRRRVEVRVATTPGIGCARVDGPRLTQVLVQLVANGIRFTADGGKVEVRARRDPQELSIAVRDTGVGIALDRQRHLFERAFAVRDSLHHHSSSGLEFNSGGLGLGLAIARGIVEAHGGSIAVESAPGRGSTFTVRIPLEGTASARAA